MKLSRMHDRNNRFVSITNTKASRMQDNYPSVIEIACYCPSPHVPPCVGNRYACEHQGYVSTPALFVLKSKAKYYALAYDNTAALIDFIGPAAL